jgi:hypothetical protein
MSPEKRHHPHERFFWSDDNGQAIEGTSEMAQIFDTSQDFAAWLTELRDIGVRAEYPDSAIQQAYVKNPSWWSVLRAYGADQDAQTGDWETVAAKLAGPMRSEWEGVVRGHVVINKYLTLAPTNNPPVPGTPDKGWSD